MKEHSNIWWLSLRRINAETFQAVPNTNTYATAWNALQKVLERHLLIVKQNLASFLDHLVKDVHLDELLVLHSLEL